MTRLFIYAVSLTVFTAATLMTIVSIGSSHWLTFSAHSSTGTTLNKHIGLHRECSSAHDPECGVFPRHEMCLGEERYFCSMWRTIGFLMSLAVIFEMATAVSLIVVTAGGKLKRARGWPIVTTLLVADSAIQLACMGIAAYLFDNDEQFIVPGWHLDTAWYLCTFSAIICVMCAVALVASAYFLPHEDGYEILDAENPKRLTPDADSLYEQRLRSWGLCS